MTKPYEVTLTSKRVVVYLRDELNTERRADLTPEQAREFARDLTIHADDVEAIAQDELEQMS